MKFRDGNIPEWKTRCGREENLEVLFNALLRNQLTYRRES